MTVTYSIESVQFRGKFLGLDSGQDVLPTVAMVLSKVIRCISRGHFSCSGASQANPDGVGVVNCRASVGDHEKFHFNAEPNKNVAIESALFPNVYLRLDGR
jgi:hypothetical protein